MMEMCGTPQMDYFDTRLLHLFSFLGLTATKFIGRMPWEVMTMIKLLVLHTGLVLVSKIDEVGGDIGEPDCRLDDPYVVGENDTYTMVGRIHNGECIQDALGQDPYDPQTNQHCLKSTRTSLNEILHQRANDREQVPGPWL